MKTKEIKRVMSVKLTESLIGKYEKEAKKQRRTVHFLMCEAIEKGINK